MALERVTVTLDRWESPDRDDVQNVWHVQTPVDMDNTDRGIISAFFESFYEAIGTKISALISRSSGVHHFRWAEVNMGAPGEGDDDVSPIIYDHPWTLNATAGAGPLPGECAAVLSLEADTTGLPEELGATRPASRRRGRVFLGPLTTDSVEAISGDVYLTSATRTQILDAANVLVDNLAANGVSLRVYSRAGGANYPVIRGWVDNAVDIQRRRGATAFARTEMTF